MTTIHDPGGDERRRRCTKRDRNKPVAHDDTFKVTLYRPTPSVPSWRLTYSHPVTGARVLRRYRSETTARDAFTETLSWVTAAGPAPAPRPSSLHGSPTMAALWRETVRAWELEGVSTRYLMRCDGIWRNWIAPVCADETVDAFFADANHARQVLDAARRAGLAPATIQNIGAVLSVLVSVAHDRRWAPPSKNPLRSVCWAARNARRNGPSHVPMKLRPTLSMVEDLIDAFDTIGGKLGVDDLGLLPAMGGIGGLRLGEQTAVMGFQWDGPSLSLDVCQAWREIRRVGMQLHAPKNGNARPVLLPASVGARLDARVALLPATPDALVVPHRSAAPATPWTEGVAAPGVPPGGPDDGLAGRRARQADDPVPEPAPPRRHVDARRRRHGLARGVPPARPPLGAVHDEPLRPRRRGRPARAQRRLRDL